MLPAAYATPVAMIFVVGGLLACFAGYRLFRVVLGIYGFIFGAAITTSIMGAAGTLALVVAALVGGLVGAILMVAAYFIGVGLIGAGLAALALNAAWHALRQAEPPTVVLVIVSVIGALAALSVVRYVVVFGTALSGSWTTLAGGLALAGNRVAAVKQAAPHAAADVLVVYPLNPLPPSWWVYAGWLGLALAGVIVQLATTSKLAGPKKAPAKK